MHFHYLGIINHSLSSDVRVPLYRWESEPEPCTDYAHAKCCLLQSQNTLSDRSMHAVVNAARLSGCCRRARRKAASLDAYAPRTQSIVWPALPAETARVVEVTFLHTPGAVDCLCRGCCQARNVLCLEDCLNATECFVRISQRKYNTVNMKAAQSKNVEKLLLLLLLLIGYPQLFEASNFTDDYWQTESQSVEEDDNATTNSSGYRIISDINDKNSIYIPVDPLMRVAFVALLLHVLIVGGGIIIYSVVYCKSRTDKKRLMEMKRRLQSPPTLQHLPNSQNCPCHGCRVARQILSGLIVQQIITERSEC
ncbi:uncharacterized protein LOC115758179 [Drosophila novamexicana]|uniref:uncharacterized protein LOC115758179 n=1 Tax=Drosophila novamexicana TaxID=47314 RepID=UPI0011E599E3|nr:uncharacterized protein LOC115758179 [Drosophila novamexicana]